MEGLSEFVDVDVLEDSGAVSTGSFIFDSLTGVGGLPRGRVVEMFGDPSSGKSTIAYQCAAQFQKAGGWVLILDYENSFLPQYGSALGIDVLDGKSFAVVPPPLSLEDGFALAERVTVAAREARVPLLVIFDSLANMVPQAAVEREGIGENNMAAAHKAKMVKEGLDRSVGLLKDAGAVWLFINHAQEVISTGPSFVKKLTTPGGTAVKFHSAMRIHFQLVKKLTGSMVDAITGQTNTKAHVANLVKIKLVKNKVGFPYREGEVMVRLGVGVDEAYSVFSVAKARDYFPKSGNTYDVFGKDVVGQEKVIEYLRANPDVLSRARTELSSVIEDAWEAQQQTLLTSVPNISEVVE